MKTNVCSLCRLALILLVLSAVNHGRSLHARVLDNFDDNTKTAWSDFTFNAALGPSKEVNGQLRFELPAVGQSIFIASQKTSEIFELKEGRTIEFRVDVIQGGAKDSFAVLAFIPNTGGNSPGTLAGYGFAKSTTDILITKGINKYFVADSGAVAQLKQDNITMVLRLTAKNGNVILTAQALDKDNNNALLWEKTVVDTPAADVLASGTDSPAAPYLTTGYFTLYLYEDFDSAAPENPYIAYYDNAEVYVTDTTVLDDFNDNTKTDWTDFTFNPALGPSKEVNGQLQFELPAVGQSIFIASQKTSRVFELTEGERVEFSVDVAQGGAKDSFAVLAFIPNTGGNSPGTLAGYGFAKSTTDILITKGINKYFIADAGAVAQLKQDNITMVLTMTVKNGSVIIEAKVLDKDNNDAVLWDKTVVDTSAADVLASGTDSPAAPYITTGYFTLYLYEDFDSAAPESPYKAYYDNAIVSAPPVAANTAPIISGIQPAEFADFLPASTQVSFAVADDKPLIDGNISVTLNGTKFTKTNGLAVAGTGNNRTATLGGLSANINYTAVLTAVDSDGAPTSRTLYFDTFDTNSFVIEIEDYNFNSGQFIDNPMVIPEGNGPQADAYSQQTGVQDVDFNDTRTAPRAQNAMYRSSDPIRMQRTLDSVRAKYIAAGGVDLGVYDYDVGDIASGEWLNYTRTFAPGSYEVYLREAMSNMATGESVLELVTGDPSQANPTTKVLGSFLGVLTGFQYRNFLLTDGTGQNKVILRLSGASTLRLRQVTADAAGGGRFQNYLILIPTADTGLQRASVTAISPAPNSTIESVTPSLSVTIQNRDTTVQTNSIVLTLNGNVVSPNIAGDTNGATVTYNITPLPAPNSTNTARIVFADNLNVKQTNEWSFVLTYKALEAANRSATAGQDRGLSVRVVQAPAGSGLANSLARAEEQLATNSTIPIDYTTNVVADFINYNKVEGSSGYFPNDIIVPELNADGNGTEDFAVEILGYLDLSAGVHRFGVVTDDGYKITSGRSLKDANAQAIGFHNGGPANETFDFVVPQAGLYPVRMLWYERGGAAYAEWFSVDLASGERILINDPNSANAVKAYVSLAAAPAIQVESSDNFKGAFAFESAAVLDTTAKTITLTPQGNTRFYRLKAASALRIKTIQLVTGKAVLTYE